MKKNLKLKFARMEKGLSQIELARKSRSYQTDHRNDGGRGLQSFSEVMHSHLPGAGKNP